MSADEEYDKSLNEDSEESFSEDSEESFSEDSEESFSEDSEESSSEESLLKPDTLIVTSHNTYYVDELLGEGGFGIVARCINVETGTKVALKMLKESDEFHELELYYMAYLRENLQYDRFFIKFVDNFFCKGHNFLVLELLDKSLLDFLNERDWKPLHLMKIRPIAGRMLAALEQLKQIEVVHTDIKLDNIMFDFCDQHTALRVKLIDFGCAADVSDMVDKDKIQVVGYRAPEVILGLPMTEAVDMWSLGAVLGTLFLGRHFYPIVSEYEQLRIIVQMQGLPGDHLLKAGRKVRRFFTESHDSSGQAWRMKTRDEYEQETGETVTRCSARYKAFNSFKDLLKKKYPCKTEKKDTKAFISLLKRMLYMDPKTRITPSEALGHSFITMKHLRFGENHFLGYKEQSHFRMAVSRLNKFLPRQSEWTNEADSGDLSWNTTSSSENDTEGSTKASVDQAVSRRKTCILENSGGTDDEITAPLVEDVANNRKSISKSKGGTKDQITAVAHQEEKITKLTAPLENPSVSDGVTKDKRITAASLTIRKDRPPQEVAVTNTEPAKNITDETNEVTQEEEEDPSDIMEVKTKKKHFRRIRKFCSRMIRKVFACCRGADDD